MGKKKKDRRHHPRPIFVMFLKKFQDFFIIVLRRVEIPFKTFLSSPGVVTYLFGGNTIDQSEKYVEHNISLET